MLLRPLAIRDALASHQSTTLAIDVASDTHERLTFELPFAPKPKLIIAGAGHVGQAIAMMATSCEFDVTVIDDREDIMTATSAKRVGLLRLTSQLQGTDPIVRPERSSVGLAHVTVCL